MNDKFYMAFRDVEHETSLEVDFFAIKKASENFKSWYDGYIGLAPYSATNRDKDKSLLYQLQKIGLIEHMIVSFYTTFDHKSSIKFGSWDEEGLKEGTSLQMLKTFDVEEWKIPLNEV